MTSSYYWVQIPYAPEFFSGLILTTSSVVIIPWGPVGTRGDPWGPVGTRGDQWGPDHRGPVEQWVQKLGTRGDPWGPVGTRGDQWGPDHRGPVEQWVQKTGRTVSRED